MRIVLDTNVVLVSIPKKSPYRKIFDNLLSGNYELILSNDILSEYLELLELKANSYVAINFANLILKLRNVTLIDIYNKWSLITSDPDDNKYVDAYISGGADYIVSNDKHFRILNEVDFPKVIHLTIDEFIKLLT